MAGLMTWAFRSPVRLGLTVGAGLVVIFGIGAAVSMMSPHPATTGSTPTTVVSSGAGFGSAAPGGTDAQQHYLRTAVAFATVWAKLANGQTPEQWHSAVRALATAELAKGLDVTDPSTLPGGTPTGATFSFISQTSALVQVPLSTGKSVLITVIHADQSWLVSDVQPYAGN